MNSVIIHGRLTRDPEKKEYTNSKGEKGHLTTISVAVDRKFGDATDFFECTSYGKLADIIHKHFSKGREIVVRGSMECDKYTAKDGTNRYPWRLKMDSFDFCGKKSDASPGASGASPGNQEDDIPEGFEPADEDDLPF